MSTKEMVEFVLRLFEILTAWPIILLLVIVLFRREIRNLMPELAQRLKKASVAGSSFEFSAIAVNALQDAIESGAEEYKDKPDHLVSFVREQVRKLPEVGTVAPSGAVPLSGRSILWVDDKPMNNVYEASILKRLGASIVSARSTEEALAFLNRDSYDLIISDVHRVENGHSNPNAGYDLLDALNRQQVRTSLVFYTGSVARINSHRAKAAHGAADVPGDLVNLVMNVLQY